MGKKQSVFDTKVQNHAADCDNFAGTHFASVRETFAFVLVGSFLANV